MKRALFFLLCIPFVLFGNATFHVHDLRTLENQKSVATSINESGQIVGTYSIDEKQRVFFWDPNNGLVPTDLVLPTTESSCKPKIDEEGGLITSAEGKTSWPISWFKKPSIGTIYWTPENGPLERPVPRDWGNKQTVVVASNTKGGYVVTDPKRSFYAIWHEGEYHKLPESMFSDVCDINNFGAIVGTIYKEIGSHRVAQVAVYAVHEDKYKIFPMKWQARGLGINDHGDIIGTFENEVMNSTEGFLLTHEGTFISLGSFAPNAINNKRQVIGSKIIKGEPTPFLYEEGRYINLNYVCHLHEPNNPWQRITEVHGINDKGQIVGKGFVHFSEHALFLDPDRPLSHKSEKSPFVSGIASR